MGFEPLYHDLPGLAIDAIHLGPDGLVLAARPTARTAPCPECGRHSDRVQSRYARVLADRPWLGLRVSWRVAARRFACRHAGCSRRVFCERLPAAPAHARTSARLAADHTALGFAAGGEAGSRLAARLGMPASPDTLLRRVRRAALPAHPAPRVVGVDDWAWRKGCRYGTILVDLERRAVLDLLPDRTADGLAAWLRAHPGVEVVARDRAEVYARGAAAGAPRATQVADRWHLLKNLRDTLARLFQRHAPAVRGALRAAAGAPAGPPPPAGRRATAAASRARRQARYEEARDRHRRGQSLKRIAREMGLCFRTVVRYVRGTGCPAGAAGGVRRSQVDPFRAYIVERWAAGCRNVAELARELRARGYRGGISNLRRYVRRLVGGHKLNSPGAAATPPAVPPALPSATRLAGAVVGRPENQPPGLLGQVPMARAAHTELAEGVGLAERFAALVRKEAGGNLADWLEQAGGSTCPEFRGFARGLREDRAAVQAALDLPWSNGPVEGHVNRLKALKRAMYGRAKFDLLRAKVLAA